MFTGDVLELTQDDINHLKTTPQYPFIAEMVARLTFKTLSEAEEQSLRNVYDAASKVYKETSNAPDVIEEANVLIRGEIIATKRKLTAYQDQICLIKRDNGQHLWGTIPKPVRLYSSKTLTHPHNLIGFEVEFVANTLPSLDKNPKKGIYSRPRKARVIKESNSYMEVEKDVTNNQTS